MQTRRRYRHRSQGRSRHLNTPDAIRHRRALADAKREELAATLPPSEKLVVVPVRLTEAQKAKLQRIGVQRLRDWLDRCKE